MPDMYFFQEKQVMKKHRDSFYLEVDTSYQMRVLSAIAISFVVLGHINFFQEGFIPNNMTELGTFYGWFPYYSFHLPIFLFITGYYFRDIVVKKNYLLSLGRFILKKAYKLLVPYYIFSGIALAVGTWIAAGGFTFSESFTLETWLLAPWKQPYIIAFSTPAWYLVALFITEVYYVLLRKAASVIKNEKVRETVLLIVVLLIGLASLYIKSTYPVSPAGVVYLRSAVMLFFVQLGLCYKKFWEKRDCITSGLYFLIIFAVQFLIIILSDNSRLSPGLFDLEDFGRMDWVYFASGITGIALWLRVSKLIASIPRKSKSLMFIGANTKYIMAFHVLGWFLLNNLMAFLVSNHILGSLLSEFSSGWYHTFLYYAQTDNPRMIILYYLAGMSFPLLIAKIVQIVAGWLKKLIGRNKVEKVEEEIAEITDSELAEVHLIDGDITDTDFGEGEAADDEPEGEAADDEPEAGLPEDGTPEAEPLEDDTAKDNVNI